MEEIVKGITKQIKDKISKTPDVAIVLGSGLSDIVDEFDNKVVIPYSELNNMLLSSVEGHKNQFVYGEIGDKSVLLMQGRLHLYDGYAAKQVAMPIYVFKELGIKTIIFTNAAGGINENFNTGDLVLITDHINRTNTNCMIGGPIIDYGKDFVDMSNPYKLDYLDLCREIAKKENITLKEGTYIQFIGPFYETKAEIAMAKIIGADLVGMSTVLEVEAANHCGLNVLALSLITNKAAGLSNETMNHKDVLDVAHKSSGNLKKIILEFLKKI